VAERPNPSGGEAQPGTAKSLWRDWTIAIVVLAVFTSLYFGDFLFRGKVIYESDSLLVSYATRYYAVDQLREGKIPQWNKDYYLGYWFLAEGQAGVFDPFTLIMALFPLSWFAWLYHFLLALRFFLIGVFTFGWLRSETENSGVSLFGAVTLPFSGFFISHIFHPHLVGVVGWTPLLLWLWHIREKAPERRRTADAGFVLVSAWQILMGHFPGLALSWSAIGFFVLFKGAMAFLNTETARSAFAGLGAVLRLWFIAALITAFQWLPTLSESRGIGRALIPPINEGFLLVEHWALLVNPTLLGDFFYEKGGYIGWLPLVGLFALLTALVIPRWRGVIPARSLIYAALAVWFLWFTLGPYSFFYRTLAQIPPFSLLRYPSRYLADFGIFAVGAVCIFGAAVATRSPRLARWLPLLVALQIADVFARGFGYTVPADKSVVDIQPARVAEVRRLLAPGQRALSAGFRYFQTYRYPDFVVPGPGNTQEPSEILAFFTASRYRYPVISFIQQTSLLPRRFVGFINELQIKPDTQILDFLGVKVLASPPDHEITAVQHEDYERTFTSASGYAAVWSRIEEVSKARFVTAPVVVEPQRRPHFVQRGMFGTKKIYLSRDKNVLDFMLSARFDIVNQVLFEVPPNLREIRGPASRNPEQGPCAIREPPAPRQIAWVEDAPGLLTLCVSAPVEGFVVVAEQYHKNWRARINGAQAPVLRGNYAFLTVPVSPGEHEVRLEFIPVEFYQGLYIAVAGFVIFIYSLVLPGLRLEDGKAS
jgi:hypothetical protein